MSLTGDAAELCPVLEAHLLRASARLVGLSAVPE